jgi:hypothetical protein
MGRERAHHWLRRWPSVRSALNADSVLQQVIAIDAARRLGLTPRRVLLEVRGIIARHSNEALLYFDPVRESVPEDVPRECVCGLSGPRGRRTCARCGRRLRMLSPYEIWYYALTSVYFCKRLSITLDVSLADLLSRLPGLRPYPRAGTRDHYQAVYAVTHMVYVLNGYGAIRLPSRRFSRERAFLAASLQPALNRGEPDTVSEIVDSLLGLGVSDAHPLIRKGRTFLLETQQPDGGWGDEGDDYGRFHTIWAAIDALRDHAWVT